MRKTMGIFFLLTVCVLLAAGCGKQMANAEAESIEGTEVEQGSMEYKKTSEPETEEADGTEQQAEEQLGQETETQESEGSTEPQNGGGAQPEETEKPVLQEPAQQAGTQPNPESAQRADTQPNPEPTQQADTQPDMEPEKAGPVSYSPQRVAELAVEMVKAQGKTYIPDDLNRMLAAGEISQEDYNACYPTDGAGYIEYYVAADMNEARDISGTVQLNSEADIAADIAGMYAALPQQYFYIDYHGTVLYGEKECHIFYCYRA